MKTALSIAGSDPSGGAGIQADLKTMTMHGVYAMSAVTAQNTTGVRGVLECSPEFLALQLDCIFSDIVPDAVKTGMVSSAPLIRVIVDRLIHYQAQNLVVDPVMVSTSGSRLLEEAALEALRERLLPLAILITPNIPEAEVLSGLSIQDEQGMEEAARIIGDSCGCAVLCKGGHAIQDADDVLYNRGQLRWFRGERIDNPNTHGTGCTLSSAIAANLALGLPLEESVARAKDYLSGALRAMLDLGAGSGPLNHAYPLTEH